MIMVVDDDCWMLAKIQGALLHSVPVRSHPETMYTSGDQLRALEVLLVVLDRETQG